MRRYRALLVGAAILLAIVAAFAAARTQRFDAHLTGTQEIPKVRTLATGDAMLNLDRAANTLHYRLTVRNISDVTAAHIHMAPAGKKGDPVVTLFPMGSEKPKPGKVSGVLAAGKVTEKNLIGPLARKPFADLVKAMDAGHTYVSVHTKAHPDGEIRGQVRTLR